MSKGKPNTAVRAMLLGRRGLRDWDERSMICWFRRVNVANVRQRRFASLGELSALDELTLAGGACLAVSA
jgi:hypothetical protein